MSVQPDPALNHPFAKPNPSSKFPSAIANSPFTPGVTVPALGLAELPVEVAVRSKTPGVISTKETEPSVLVLNVTVIVSLA